MPQETREILFGDCKISIESALKMLKSLKKWTERQNHILEISALKPI